MPTYVYLWREVPRSVTLAKHANETDEFMPAPRGLLKRTTKKQSSRLWDNSHLSGEGVDVRVALSSQHTQESDDKGRQTRGGEGGKGNRETTRRPIRTRRKKNKIMGDGLRGEILM